MSIPLTLHEFLAAHDVHTFAGWFVLVPPVVVAAVFCNQEPFSLVEPSRVAGDLPLSQPSSSPYDTRNDRQCAPPSHHRLGRLT